MDIKEKRRMRSAISIDQRLIAEGTAQLSSEIEILQSWLDELERADVADMAAADARIAYRDMLRSRKEMFQALTKLSESHTEG
ncbi:MAG: hypothetical protein Q8L60_02570 [Gammaproteobacteria bacterium]|nr:hypothetical protein [Gammaproteobacteria bacterium]MDP2141111.1 hypothetical protein [Gammaproteobacteria bacterium]MDP2349214.1 hypothetical protein [Gammaproteobacteria bacterium]